MSLIDDIKARLSKYPNARYESSGSSISVFPSSENGFTVELTVNHVSYTVSFEGWHEDFDDEEEALNCFVFGLSDECRLKECRRGGFAYKWTVESRQDGNGWRMGRLDSSCFPFGKSPRSATFKTTF